MSFLDNIARKLAEKQVALEDQRAEREAQNAAIRQARIEEAAARREAESVGAVSEQHHGNGFCGHCGAPIREGALFCFKCGTRVPEQAADAEVLEPEEAPEHLEPIENPEEEVKENPDTPQAREDISEDE